VDFVATILGIGPSVLIITLTNVECGSFIASLREDNNCSCVVTKYPLPPNA